MADELIAVDWGTTSLRAYRLDGGGRTIASTRSEHGIQTRQGGFEATLGSVIVELKAADDAPVLMAGMIGSRQGWVEAPYIETPCDVRRLAQQLTDIPTALHRPVKIVPGLCDLSRDAPDVMRGEEAKLLGLLGGAGARFETICMPGTHCKWASAREGQVLGFLTYMTGEVFAVLCEHSILGRLMQPGEPPEADDWQTFDRGVEHSSDRDHLLHHLFSVRTLGLFDRLPATGLKSYLSGLLVGHEIRSAAFGARGPVALLGDRRLTARYERALSRLELAHERVEEDIIVKGLAAIARSARLIRASASTG
ncbi:MAG: 2-dehydro-3-deoxygalactonokinase [Methylobacteriaceae bacterium]|nr:2-dehydro-3-deoxygalactonokinase [Methylobacteriaceae bacterium]MBV9704207.1 2-dehydro-3-deoxygalactonokinase [Methylobacteriaceae bacterium]